MSVPSHTVRRAQIIGPFGPGAIIDLIGESFVAEDASRWWGRQPTIRMPRLATRLRTPELRSPSERVGVPYYRFPEWLFCQQCRLMARWRPSMEAANRPPTCQWCKGNRPLVPMRFIAVCGNGHLTDIDWRYWAHRDQRSRDQLQCQTSGQLHFVSRPEVGSGLASLEIQCRSCKARRSLEQITSKGMLRQRCTGRQPWQFQLDETSCDEPLIGMQRGASSVYFPDVVSALDLPPDSDWDVANAPVNRLRSRYEFRALVEDPRHRLRGPMLALLAEDLDLPVAEVERAVEFERGEQLSSSDAGTEEDIAPEEWRALLDPRDSDPNPRNHFITRRAVVPDRDSLADPALSALAAPLADVILV
ncbi:MAG: hypothetical protein J2P17_16820, partial [Mycobacterium sp.]|nr:hypothetical protein [Mycobacterium sp.]